MLLELFVADLRSPFGSTGRTFSLKEKPFLRKKVFDPMESVTEAVPCHHPFWVQCA